MLQSRSVLLQRNKITPVHLGNHHIQVPPAYRRPFPDQAQILRRKDDALQAAHHIREPFDLLLIQQDHFLRGLIRHQAHGDLPLHAPGPHVHAACRKALPDPHRALVPGDPVALAKGAIMNGLQQVRFAGAIRAEEQIDPFVRGQYSFLVISEITESQLFNNHYWNVLTGRIR